jgi:hypothetical protein
MLLSKFPWLLIWPVLLLPYSAVKVYQLIRGLAFVKGIMGDQRVVVYTQTFTNLMAMLLASFISYVAGRFIFSELFGLLAVITIYAASLFWIRNFLKIRDYLITIRKFDHPTDLMWLLVFAWCGLIWGSSIALGMQH